LTAPGAGEPLDALDALHHGDPVMHANVETAKRVMERNVSVVLLGETGTGKERFARAMHLAGNRASRPFVAINCASIPESLVESELFGYRAGAFTGASKEGQRGKLLQANGGTLFLDEIGDMPVALQARLLRVLEEREVVPLGGETPVRLDIRVVSATHCDLAKKIESGTFREDLYYRLQGVTFTMPPLRERLDRGALIRQLALEESDPGNQVELDDQLLALLERQRWPGNLRQLRHLLRTMIALRETDRLGLHDLPPEFRPDLAEARMPPAAVPGQAAAAPATPAAPANKPGEGLNPFECAEREVLLQELKRHQWNLSGVARELNISRNTLYRKLQRLNIEHPDKSLFH
jgi:transcriptional regulator of acetoin/glycerol metabolism